MYDAVYIIWDDSMADNFKWRTVEDALDWEEESLSYIHTVGYLLFDTDTHYVITSSYHPTVENAGHSDTNIMGLLRIPKCAVVSYEVLVKSESE